MKETISRVGRVCSRERGRDSARNPTATFHRAYATFPFNLPPLQSHVVGSPFNSNFCRRHASSIRDTLEHPLCKHTYCSRSEKIITRKSTKLFQTQCLNHKTSPSATSTTVSCKRAHVSRSSFLPHLKADNISGNNSNNNNRLISKTKKTTT